MSDGFSVQQIDHVELFVPDLYEAAAWYRKALGLEILGEYEHFAASGKGPLFISSDVGSTNLALFRGKPRGRRETAGHHLVAFRVDGEGFLQFVRRAADCPLYDDQGDEIAEAQAVDHKMSFSTYFCDPWGNRFEVTTYDHDFVSERL